MIIKVLIVPAETVFSFNNIIGTYTEKRCQSALRLWQTGDYNFMVLTGGIFLPPNRQNKPAAEIMKDWFLSQNIKAASILTEKESLDTFQNFIFSLDLIKKKVKNFEFTVITHWTQALRFQITARMGYGVSIKTKPLYYKISVLELFKEILYILYHLIDPRGQRLVAEINRKKRRQNKNLEL